MDNTALYGLFAAFASAFQQNVQRMLDACGDDQDRKSDVDLAYTESQVQAVRARVQILERDGSVAAELSSRYADASKEAVSLLKGVQADAGAVRTIADAVDVGDRVLKSVS